MHILFVSAESAPWAWTGGLGGVVGALPSALVRSSTGSAGVQVLLPLYRRVREIAERLGRTLEPLPGRLALRLGAHDLEARLHRWAAPDGVEHLFLEQQELFDRGGGPYDHGDNAARFAFFCRAALEAAARGLLPGGAPDVIHCHDWPTAPLPMLLTDRYRERLPATRSVLTLHNLRHQGSFPAHEYELLGLHEPPGALFELGDRINFLRGGIECADAVSTVSPNHAREILEPEMAFGLDGLLGSLPRPLVGILNGIDVDAWDPASDPHIAAPYSAGDLAGKEACRAALLAEFGLAERGDLLLGVVSRLDPQKGLDLLAEVVPGFSAMGAQLVVLGTGSPDLEATWTVLAGRYVERVGVHIAFDHGQAHRIIAGADAVVMPSRYEPCGLTQMYALRYGTVPIVHPVGGLNDTVIDTGDEDLMGGRATGIRFFPLDAGQLAHGIDRLARLRRSDPEGFGRLRRACMDHDSSWDRSARLQLELYRTILAEA